MSHEKAELPFAMWLQREQGVKHHSEGKNIYFSPLLQPDKENLAKRVHSFRKSKILFLQHLRRKQNKLITCE